MYRPPFTVVDDDAEIRSFGPKGLVEMTRHFWELNRFDVDTRMADEGKPDPRKLLVPRFV